MKVAVAYEGMRLGAETFVSFDKKAVEMLTARGVSLGFYRILTTESIVRNFSVGDMLSSASS